MASALGNDPVSAARAARLHEIGEFLREVA
jgi:hypothetical protein